MNFDHQTAADFTTLARQLALQPTLDATLQAIVQQALVAVPGAEEAGITLCKPGGRLGTVAATGAMPEAVDDIQYATDEGPCIGAIREQHVFLSDDVADDPRWPNFGPRAAEETEVASMLSHRLYLEDGDSIGGLNLYSRKPAAFTDESRVACTLLAAHAAIALATAAQREQSANLQLALKSSRRIGIAIGVLMTRHKITADRAFDLLRIESQHSHRKLRDIAEIVIDTGTLDTA